MIFLPFIELLTGNFQCLLNPFVSPYNDAIYHPSSYSWSDQTRLLCKFLSKKRSRRRAQTGTSHTVVHQGEQLRGPGMAQGNPAHQLEQREWMCLFLWVQNHVEIGWQHPEIWMAFDISLSSTCDQWQVDLPYHESPWEEHCSSCLLKLRGPKQGAGSGSGPAKQWTSEHSSCISS